jgi:Cytochrome c7 and related cytochrome c
MNEERGTQREIAKSYRDRVQSRFTRTVWRSERFLLSVVLFAGGIVAIYYCEKEKPQDFFNTGPLSRSHAHLKDGCVSCHVPERLTSSSAGQPPALFQVLNDRFEKGAPSFERIDRACGQCHKQHDFHEPNVIMNRSCSACHTEHQGLNGLMAVANLDCASCHNNSRIMQASADRGKQLPPTRFHLNPKLVNFRQVTLQLPRPADGYTKTFASFSEGHPPFQLQRENVRDNDVLRFNHARHLNSRDIPPTKAGKLDCNYCHQPEPNGRYMQPISFEANCQECHSLQFDVRNPDFQLPHGDAQLVRTFLRTLPAQYAELARRKRGLTNETKINEFAVQQVRQLLTQFSNAQELERSVFFTRDPYKGSQQNDASSRAKYTGCAFCHEVKQAAGISYPTAEITKPVMIERWLPHAHFSHAKHATVASCRECHVAAASSRLTSDVLMPTKESCVRCHSAAGIARKASECATCHLYHSPEQPNSATISASTNSFEQMLLGPSRSGVGGPSR